jgi:Uma2 family endonuclease
MITYAVTTDAPRVIGPAQGHWTIDDWEKLPDDGNRYEIIGGVLYASRYVIIEGVPGVSTSPSNFHQWIISRLVELVGIPAKGQNLAYYFFAPIGLLLPTGDAIQPDFALVLTEHAAIIRDRRVRGVPDLIVEVLSPGNSEYDLDTKMKTYAAAGVPEYGIIDPAARTLNLYQLIEVGHYTEPLHLAESDAAHFSCAPSISFKIGDLFVGAPDTAL